ncbi:MAG: hypothetical protein ACP5G0_10250, partial [Desulfomonilia bacterium]
MSGFLKMVITCSLMIALMDVFPPWTPAAREMSVMETELAVVYFDRFMENTARDVLSLYPGVKLDLEE